MSKKAKGTFQVSLSPEASAEGAGATLGRMKIDKTYEGDLTGTAKGEMLTAVCNTEGSAGYVAIEEVQGAVNGKSGSFVLQHTGTMTNNGQQVSITVVPDSATGDLSGMTGELSITIVDGEHSYELSYSLPRSRSR